MRRTNGFSLLELLMAVSIMALLASMLYAIFNTTSQAWKNGESKIQSIQNARIFLDKVSSELSSATVQNGKNINMIVMASAIYFVNKGVYSNGSVDIDGYQQSGYYLKTSGSSDTDFTDDNIIRKSIHSQSSAGFDFAPDFSNLSSQTEEVIASYAADLRVDCWNQLNSTWISWDSWPGSPPNAKWDVLTPVSSNDPDDAGYEPSDPSNKGKMPAKIKITVKMIKPDTAQWINTLNPTSFNNYTAGQTGTNREKIIGALEKKGLLQQYSLIVDLPETKQ